MSLIHTQRTILQKQDAKPFRIGMGAFWCFNLRLINSWFQCKNSHAKTHVVPVNPILRESDVLLLKNNFLCVKWVNAVHYHGALQRQCTAIFCSYSSLDLDISHNLFIFYSFMHLKYGFNKVFFMIFFLYFNLIRSFLSRVFIS